MWGLRNRSPQPPSLPCTVLAMCFPGSKGSPQPCFQPLQPPESGLKCRHPLCPEPP
jgi:hypothetical protein